MLLLYSCEFWLHVFFQLKCLSYFTICVNSLTTTSLHSLIPYSIGAAASAYISDYMYVLYTTEKRKIDHICSTRVSNELGAGNSWAAQLSVCTVMVLAVAEAIMANKARERIFKGRILADKLVIETVGQSEIEKAVSLLWPLIVFGKGAAIARAENGLKKLVETTGIPFFPTRMGKGLLPDTHELAATVARSLAIGKCDVALVVGARLNWDVILGVGSPAPIVVSEGANTMDVGRSVLVQTEPRTRLDAGTWGTMGVGLGYCIAAAVASPDRLVVAVEGDSGFGFSAMEVELLHQNVTLCIAAVRSVSIQKYELRNVSICLNAQTDMSRFAPARK
ncbi:hypothetical protein RHGRI_028845 [Rhododendron griersonianum]|uniref:2-hydroxyacyl-CoA lyase n=1 Tax=Rhododendron griersonianum TaxID=479676 RepID=A0AAV6IM09_9ERIC|nr:hypothetical protein RHGRI_028845 [Rhododendron griersonianum]